MIRKRRAITHLTLHVIGGIYVAKSRQMLVHTHRSLQLRNVHVASRVETAGGWAV